MPVWRHVRAILLLPVVVTLIVPALVVWAAGGVGWGLPVGLAASTILLGLTLVGLGVALVVWTVGLFVAEGEGTLAPWDPTSKLVVRGPYRYVRHPMIGGVLAILLGEALLLGSTPLLGWFAAVLAVNAVYLPLVEEPGLVRRFGEDYEAYRADVPRFVPRLSAWDPAS